MGAWTGSWSAPGAPRGGSVGLLLAPGTEPGRTMGQFTFIHGAKSRTVRYEGTVADGVIRFALPTDGEIVLRREASALVGQWSGRQTIAPAATGTFVLTRGR